MCIEPNKIKDIGFLDNEFRKKPEKLLYLVKSNDIDMLSLCFYWSYVAYHLDTKKKYDLFEKPIDYEIHTLRYYKKSPFGYFVFHKSSKTVIIGIRGAIKFRDFVSIEQIRNNKKYIPDFFYTYGSNFVEYIESLYDLLHPGILNHAIIMYAMLIENFAKVEKDFAIHVHGHSLGAACSVIVCHLLAKNGYTNVHCHCLSCPQIFPVCFKDNNFTYKHFYTEQDPITIGMHKLFDRWYLFKYKDTKANESLSLAPLITHRYNTFLRNLISHGSFFKEDTVVISRKYKDKVIECDKASFEIQKMHSYKPKAEIYFTSEQKMLHLSPEKGLKNTEKKYVHTISVFNPKGTKKRTKSPR